jgi:hypothetical protein
MSEKAAGGTLGWTPVVRHYFVDEAGDVTLFRRKGQPAVGTEGCSRYFMLGLLDVRDPEALAADMASLRARLLADAYFWSVPSLRPQGGKTARMFHAKDDLPEVRQDMFRLLLRHEVRFFAAIRDKNRVHDYVRQRNAADPTFRYDPNALYDHLVRCLMGSLLHKADEYRVHFAKRGRADRTAALRSALLAARAKVVTPSDSDAAAKVEVIACSSADAPGLQAADYFLWALQRLYERQDGRFVRFLWPAFRLVMDIDDKRGSRSGTYYTQKKPLAIAADEGLPGI